MNSIVNTQSGQVQGFSKNGAEYFLGIPYAQPPIGELRFKAPLPAKPWQGVKECTKTAAAAPQNKGILAMVKEYNEDCLYLNVVTPRADSKARPVMVWIHGGSFTSGSGEQSVYLDSTLPMQGDVVLVTINYRLGVLGFVDFSRIAETSPCHSNVGLRDMLAALTWVKNNIHAFGGDPNNVCVFGESAGAMGTACLLGSPLAKGLFQKAIMQSGAAHMTSLPEDALRVAHAFLDKAAIPVSQLEKLQELSIEEILKLQASISDIKFSNEGREKRLPVSSFVFVPTFGDDVLPIDPLEAIAQGSAKEVDVMIGTNLHEWNFFTQLSDPGKNKLDEAALHKVINTRVPGHAKEAVECYYDEARQAKAVDVFSAIESDRFFRIPAIRLLEAQLKHTANVFTYLFTYEAILLDGKLGSCHAVEIPFVMGTMHDNFAKLFVGENPDGVQLSSQCVAAWSAFAKTGSPQNALLPEWQAYDLENRATMELGKHCEVLFDPLSEQRQFWEGLL